MDGLSKRIIDNDSDYMLNLGSETIPPCKENIIHISLKKPLQIPSCQFKLLREGSLVSSRAKEIHTRMQKDINERQVYSFDNKNVNYLHSIKGLVPDSYDDYLLRQSQFIFDKSRIHRKSKKGRKGKSKGKKTSSFKRLFGTSSARKLFTPSARVRRGFGPGYRGGRVRKEAKDECFVPVE